MFDSVMNMPWIVVGNGATWDRLEHKTKIQKSKIQKILNFYLSFKFVAGQPSFLSTQNPQKLFLIY